MRLKRRIIDALAPYPRLFYPLARRFGPDKFRDYLVSDETEIVISGYPRSANTFAVTAFAEAQRRPVHIAHHVHVEAQLMEAARRGLPAIALVRNPHDAVRSLKAALPSTNLRYALRRWIRFYTRIEQLSEQVVISDFSCTTGDFASVIREVNRKFGTDYLPFEHSEANLTHVFGRMKLRQFELGTLQFGAEPSEHRRALLDAIDLPLDEAMLAEANRLYGRLLALRSVPECSTCREGAGRLEELDAAVAPARSGGALLSAGAAVVSMAALSGMVMDVAA
jgi:hypothetical protein